MNPLICRTVTATCFALLTAVAHAQGAVALTVSPHLERIQALSLRNNPLTEVGVTMLRKRFGERVSV